MVYAYVQLLLSYTLPHFYSFFLSLPFEFLFFSFFFHNVLSRTLITVAMLSRTICVKSITKIYKLPVGVDFNPLDYLLDARTMIWKRMLILNRATSEQRKGRQWKLRGERKWFYSRKTIQFKPWLLWPF